MLSALRSLVCGVVERLGVGQPISLWRCSPLSSLHSQPNSRRKQSTLFLFLFGTPSTDTKYLLLPLSLLNPVKLGFYLPLLASVTPQRLDPVAFPVIVICLGLDNTDPLFQNSPFPTFPLASLSGYPSVFWSFLSHFYTFFSSSAHLNPGVL